MAGAAPQDPNAMNAIVQLLNEHRNTILLNVGLFVAGTLFIKSPIMDNMAPQ